MKMEEELLAIIEKNSRIDLKELAIILGVAEIDVVNALQKLEEDGYRGARYPSERTGI